QAPAVGLQWTGVGDPHQRGTPLRPRPTAALQKAGLHPGLNKDHNHDLKGLFKAAATRASVQPGPFQDFYQRSLAKGIKPTMVRLTLARKLAAITLTLWKKGENFDAETLKSQAACASPVKSPSISGDLFLVVVSWFLRRSCLMLRIQIACRRTSAGGTEPL